MVRAYTILFCIALGVIITGCGGPTGLSVGWDYQDLDGDHIQNGVDLDVDGDGVLNEHDLYPLNYYAY
jgi:hypothetical protein